MVVINGLQAVREVLVDHSENTADRPPMPIYKNLGVGPHSEGKQRGVPTAARLGQGQAEAGSCTCVAGKSQRI